MKLNPDHYTNQKMQLKITEQKESPLFDRKEILAVVSTSTSPSKDEVKEELSKKFSVGKDAIRIKQIDGNFGSGEFTITANIYPSKDILEGIEHKSKKEIEQEKKAEELKKKTEEEAKAAAEKPAEEPKTEEPKEEAPAEESKTEEKTEEKTE